eukprot:1146321-Pelagomonas_calceolata.AAC.4
MLSAHTGRIGYALKIRVNCHTSPAPSSTQRRQSSMCSHMLSAQTGKIDHMLDDVLTAIHHQGSPDNDGGTQNHQT